MRIGILAFLHESNTFISAPTTYEHFASDLLVSGEQIRVRMADSFHEVGGFLAELDTADVEVVPILAARSLPYGTITATAFSRLMDRMWSELDRAGKLDGILVAPHGATVSEEHRDADGYWLSELRHRVGAAMPVIGTMDPHGNLTKQMIAATDALIAYRTNPHLDQRQRGREAARLMLRTLHGEVRPTQAAAFPPLVINIERQLTSDAHWKTHYELADAQLTQQGVLSNSICLGFPYADVLEVGSATIAVTNNDPALAQRCARELGTSLWNSRHDFVGQLISVEQAIEQSIRSPGPVCLLDMGDNVGGGSPADGTILLQALMQSPVTSAFVCLYDPEVAKQAAGAGVGAKGTWSVGGKTDKQHGTPVTAEFTVAGIYDGRFEEPQPRHGGFTKCDQGLTAVLNSYRNITVMVTSRRMPPYSMKQLTTFGVDPQLFQVLVAKGANAPVAAYREVCPTLIRVNTPGCTTADLDALHFNSRRRPLFPFETDATW